MPLLADRVLGDYDVPDFPALWEQIRHGPSRPALSGVRVLDATPCWPNTLPKYWALLAAGAQVTVGAAPGIPHDPEVVAVLPTLGIDVVLTPEAAGAVDVVLDCAGRYARVPSRFGVAELTMTGRAVYEASRRPVVMVDAGRVKLVEDLLGTGDGFVRALAALGFGDLNGRRILLFGGGKVGTGIARRTGAAGADVTIVDDPARVRPEAIGRVIDRREGRGVRAAIADAWCVVAATGVTGALAPYAADLTAGRALVANMGATDEFGPELPDERVLGGKAPLNFLLAEPTRLRYLDPSFALSNAAAVDLVRGAVPAGVHAPDPEVETRILHAALTSGSVAAELRDLMATHPWQE